MLCLTETSKVLNRLTKTGGNSDGKRENGFNRMLFLINSLCLPKKHCMMKSNLPLRQTGEVLFFIRLPHLPSSL